MNLLFAYVLFLSWIPLSVLSYFLYRHKNWDWKRMSVVSLMMAAVSFVAMVIFIGYTQEGPQKVYEMWRWVGTWQTLLGVLILTAGSVVSAVNTDERDHDLLEMLVRGVLFACLLVILGCIVFVLGWVIWFGITSLIQLFGILGAS